jgi:hypothetical protein
MQALVVVVNETQQAVNVIPSAMTLEITKPEEKTLDYIPPEKLARATLRTPWLAVLGAGLQGAGAGLQTQESTTTGSITANERLTQRPQPQIQRHKQGQETIARNAREGRRRREASAERIENTALLSKTLFSGNHIMGWVYFQRTKRYTEAVLRVPISSYSFEIPFVWTTGK